MILLLLCGGLAILPFPMHPEPFIQPNLVICCQIQGYTSVVKKIIRCRNTTILISVSFRAHLFSRRQFALQSGSSFHGTCMAHRVQNDMTTRIGDRSHPLFGFLTIQSNEHLLETLARDILDILDIMYSTSTIGQLRFRILILECQ